MKSPSQNDRILEVLRDGQPHRMEEIHQHVGFCRLNSRISELRDRGHRITCDKGGGLYVYRLIEEVEAGAILNESSGTDRRDSSSDVPGSWAPASTSSTDQPGQPLIPITRANVCGIAPAENFHADSLEQLTLDAA